MRAHENVAARVNFRNNHEFRGTSITMEISPTENSLEQSFVEHLFRCNGVIGLLNYNKPNQLIRCVLMHTGVGKQ